jgi:hypothetical protein
MCVSVFVCVCACVCARDHKHERFWVSAVGVHSGERVAAGGAGQGEMTSMATRAAAGKGNAKTPQLMAGKAMDFRPRSLANRKDD